MKFVIALVAATAALKFDRYGAEQKKAFGDFQADHSEEHQKLDEYVKARDAQAVEHKKWHAQRADLVKEFVNYGKVTAQDTSDKHLAFMNAVAAHTKAVEDLADAHARAQESNKMELNVSDLVF